VQDARAYQSMIEAVESLDARKGIAEGISSLEGSEGEPADTVLSRLRRKHGFKSGSK
jgi:hypothetical protein